MGLHMQLVLIRADGSEWIESNPAYKFKNDDGGFTRSYLRVEGLFEKWATMDFMFEDDHSCPWYGRGLPDWLTPDQREEMRYGVSPTWFTIEELAAVDWDAPLRPWPDPDWLVPQLGSRREKLGETFIAWTRMLQAEGVAKIAVTAS